MILSNVPVHSGEKIHWSASFGVNGMAEASDLLPGPLAGLVYDDAADVGFFVESPRTGEKRLFTLLERQYREGELLYQVFQSADMLRVCIFND